VVDKDGTLCHPSFYFQGDSKEIKNTFREDVDA